MVLALAPCRQAVFRWQLARQDSTGRNVMQHAPVKTQYSTCTGMATGQWDLTLRWQWDLTLRWQCAGHSVGHKWLHHVAVKAYRWRLHNNPGMLQLVQLINGKLHL